MIIKTPHKRANGVVFYTEKEVKLIKEYTNFILVEHPEGYRECINKQDLGLIKEVEKPTHKAKHINYGM